MVWVLSEPELIYWYLIGLGGKLKWEKFRLFLNCYKDLTHSMLQSRVSQLKYSVARTTCFCFSPLSLALCSFSRQQPYSLGFCGWKSLPDTKFSRMWFGNLCPVSGFPLNVAWRLPVMLPQKVISLTPVQKKGLGTAARKSEQDEYSCWAML